MTRQNRLMVTALKGPREQRLSTAGGSRIETNLTGLEHFTSPIEEGKDRSSPISTVVYHKHPDMAWLPMKDKTSLGEAFRAPHDTHHTHVGVQLPSRHLPAGADQVISVFKAEYANRVGGGFWAFWEEDRLKAGFTNVWRLTSCCGHKIILDADMEEPVRLGTIREEPCQLGVTIFYQERAGTPYKPRNITHL